MRFNYFLTTFYFTNICSFDIIKVIQRYFAPLLRSLFIMPRYYQRKKNNPYYIPGSLYDYIVACIKWAAPLLDDPERINEQTETLKREIRIIERALKEIPGKYRAAVLDSIIYEKPCPEWWAARQLSDTRARIIFIIAKDLDLISY